MKVQTVTAADAVREHLRDQLLSGHFQAGELLRDTDLAAEYGVARPTVRAAVQSLVADGLLERDKGQSAKVPSFTAADATDLYIVRRAIEAAAVTLIIKRKAPTDGIQQALADFTALHRSSSWVTVSAHHARFHREIFVAAGSERLLRAFDDVSTETSLLVAQMQPAYGSIAVMAREHAELLTVLETRKLAAAHAAWTEHFDSSENFFVNLLEGRKA